MTMYKLSGVTKDYQKGRDTVHALRGVDLVIEDRDWLSIQGPTGHGKSRANRFANTQPGTAPAGAAGNSSSHPTGAPAMIRLMPMPNIIPPTREPITPEARPRYNMSLRFIMRASQPRAGGFYKDQPTGPTSRPDTAGRKI